MTGGKTTARQKGRKYTWNYYYSALTAVSTCIVWLAWLHQEGRARTPFPASRAISIWFSKCSENEGMASGFGGSGSGAAGGSGGAPGSNRRGPPAGGRPAFGSSGVHLSSGPGGVRFVSFGGASVFGAPLPAPAFAGHPFFGGGGLASFESMMAAAQAQARDTAGSEDDIERIAQQIFAAQVPKETPAERGAVEALPSVVISPKHVADSASCSVCFDAFAAGEVGVLELPCEHLYHKGCLLPWLATHNTCPVCRAPLPAAAAAPAPAVLDRGGIASAAPPAAAAAALPMNPFAIFDMLNSSGISIGGRHGGFGPGGWGGGVRAPPPPSGVGAFPPGMEGDDEGGADEGEGEDEEDEDLRAAIAASLAEERERQQRAARGGGGGGSGSSSSGRSSPPAGGGGGRASSAGAAPSPPPPQEEGRRFSARFSVPPEPIPGEDAFTLKLRLPDASSVVRRFPPSATLGQVVEFVLSTGKRALFALRPDGSPRVRLLVAGGGADGGGAAPGPFTADDWDSPLLACGLARRAQLVVEATP